MAYPDGITKEMVDESATESMNSFSRDEWQELKCLVAVAPIEVVESNQDRATKHKVLLSIAAKISNIITPRTPCQKGCSHCCHMATAVSMYEAEIIGKHTGLNVYTPPPMESREDLVDKYTGVVCPFLKDNVCSIYEVRPISCRTHFNVSKYSEVCDIINHPGCDTPNIDLRPFWFASALVAGMDDPMGDIREFFKLEDIHEFQENQR